MKTTTIKCNCDYCNQEMSEIDYERAVLVTVRVDLPEPQGRCGQCVAIEMKLCKQCSEKIGIENLEEYHRYIDSQSRLRNTISKCKTKILELCFRRKIDD